MDIDGDGTSAEGADADGKAGEVGVADVENALNTTIGSVGTDSDFHNASKIWASPGKILSPGKEAVAEKEGATATASPESVTVDTRASPSGDDDEVVVETVDADEAGTAGSGDATVSKPVPDALKVDRSGDHYHAVKSSDKEVKAVRAQAEARFLEAMSSADSTDALIKMKSQVLDRSDEKTSQLVERFDAYEQGLLKKI